MVHTTSSVSVGEIDAGILCPLQQTQPRFKPVEQNKKGNLFISLRKNKTGVSPLLKTARRKPGQESVANFVVVA